MAIDGHDPRARADTHLPPTDGEAKFPPYLYTLIESFCLGTRRLQLFTGPATSRRGWVTASLEPTPDGYQLYDPSTYPHQVESPEGRDVLPFSPEIDSLRPKSPVKTARRGPNAAHTMPANLQAYPSYPTQRNYQPRPSPRPTHPSYPPPHQGPKPPSMSLRTGPPPFLPPGHAYSNVPPRPMPPTHPSEMDRTGPASNVYPYPVQAPGANVRGAMPAGLPHAQVALDPYAGRVDPQTLAMLGMGIGGMSHTAYASSGQYDPQMAYVMAQMQHTQISGTAQMQPPAPGAFNPYERLGHGYRDASPGMWYPPGAYRG